MPLGPRTAGGASCLGECEGVGGADACRVRCDGVARVNPARRSATEKGKKAWPGAARRRIDFAPSGPASSLEMEAASLKNAPFAAAHTTRGLRRRPHATRFACRFFPDPSDRWMDQLGGIWHFGCAGAGRMDGMDGLSDPPHSKCTHSHTCTTQTQHTWLHGHRRRRDQQ